MNKFKKRKILLAITTLSSNWKEKLKEIDKLNIKKAAAFLTGLAKEERRSFYDRIKKTNLKEVPFVHIRSDMEEKELEFFIKNYNTRVFNIHTPREYPLEYDYSKHKDKIYIENTYTVFTKKELNEFSGICLDLSHLENDRRTNKKKYKKTIQFLENFKIGCNHISAVREKPHINETGEVEKERYDVHSLNELSELNYIKNYPLDYFSEFIAIELENSLKEQLEVKKYIRDVLKTKMLDK